MIKNYKPIHLLSSKNLVYAEIRMFIKPQHFDSSRLFQKYQSLEVQFYHLVIDIVQLHYCALT